MMTLQHIDKALKRVAITAVVFTVITLWSDELTVLSANQSGYLAFKREDFRAAAEVFDDTNWKAAAMYRDAQFKNSAALYSAYEDATGYFNRGTALIMNGRHEQAIGQFDLALNEMPGWEPAIINRAIAVERAKKPSREGSEEQSSELGADEIRFDKPKNDKGVDTVLQEEQLEEAAANDKAIQAQWLRKVQTRPADFLRSKFAYQRAMQESQQGVR